MRLEPLYRIRFSYPESWAVGLDGGWQQMFFLAEGRCEGLVTGRTRVATDRRDHILGFATVVGIEGGLELEDLFVDPVAMRQGVATRLVLDAVTRAASEGVPWIEVTANRHAAEFYASVGFVHVGEKQTLFGPAPRLRRDVSPDGSARPPHRVPRLPQA